MHTITVDRSVLTEAQNIIDGVYAPLRGFTNEADFTSITQEMRLANGDVWSMPIILDIDAATRDKIAGDTSVMITDGSARFTLSEIDIYQPDKTAAVKQIFGTDDAAHPGVARYQEMGEYFIGGELAADASALFDREDPHFKTPDETKEIFRKHGWANVVAFQTRNPPHRSHEYLQKAALAEVDGLLIQPVIGPKKAGDIEDGLIIASYEVLIDKYYEAGQAELSTFHTYMRYAGPREAVFHAQVRKNFGCTHMIIGRDHAGVGDYYGTYDAQNIFDQFTREELGIEIFKYNNVSYCNACHDMIPQGECEHGLDSMSHLSGTEFRRRLETGEEIPETFMRSEVLAVLKK